jgi:hypothetical protein
MDQIVTDQHAAASETAVMPRLTIDQHDQARSGYLSPAAVAILRRSTRRGRHADPWHGTATTSLDYVPRHGAP